MSDEKKYLKAFCKKCYGKIEFPEHARGATINCPHCGGETVLSVATAAPVAAAVAAGITTPPLAATTAPAAPAAPKTPWWSKPAAAKPSDAPPATPAGAKAATARDAIATAEAKAKAKAAPAKTEEPKRAPGGKKPSQISAALASPLDEIYDELDKVKDKQFCPSCSSRIDVGLSVCPSCGTGLVRHVRIIRRWGLLLLIVLIIAFPFLLPRDFKLPISALEKQKTKFIKPARPDIEMINPTWTKSKEGSLYFVSGMVVNNSKYRYLSVKIEFDLLDKAGNSLGKTIDQLGILEPGKNWNFKAVAIDPDAVGYKFGSLTGQKAPAN